MTSAGVDDKLGKMAYDAYCTQLGGIGDLASWDELEGQYRDAWVAAARTVEAWAYGREQLDD